MTRLSFGFSPARLRLRAGSEPNCGNTTVLRYVNTYFELAASLAGASPQRWCRTLHKQDDIMASKPSLQRFATSHVPIARWRKCRLDSPPPFLQETLVMFLDVVKCVRTIS